MIIEIGHFSLILALCVAFIQVVLPLYGVVKRHVAYMRVALFTAVVQAVLVAVSFFSLIACFVLNDFSVAYVAAHSNQQLPLVYRLCALWGAHEGSMLLWVFILTLWMAAVSLCSRRIPLDMLARSLSILGVIAIGFYVFILTLSNPFIRALPDIPAIGHDLNPILQDPGMLIHPPMLYLGYVGFSVVFAFSIAALLAKRFDAVWVRWLRPWATLAWCFLTYGIVLGSWWAYRQLGWGGWWFWDPVENASLLPWLLATALLHALSATEKRGVFKSWTVLLAISTFCLSLMGTFLVRSGVLISIHAFAVEPARGQYMLMFLFAVIALSLLLYALRARYFVSHSGYSITSREMMLLLNNIFLTVAMLTVLLGTIYPLAIQAMSGDKLSVGAPYFNLIFIPLMLPFLFLMGIGPYFRWQHNGMHSIMRRVAVVIIVCLVLAIALPLLAGLDYKPWAAIGLGLAFWIIIQTLNQWIFWQSGKGLRFRQLSRSQWAMILAHCGVAITLIGITMVTQYEQQRNVSLRVAESVNIAGYTIHFDQITALTGPNYHGVRAQFSVMQHGEPISRLTPELHVYDSEQIAVAKTAINRKPWRDVYVALGEPIDDSSWAVRIYYKPFVRWIWFGGIMMVLGGLCVLLDKRYRVKTMARKLS